jgi:hypothetical protein
MHFIPGGVIKPLQDILPILMLMDFIEYDGYGLSMKPGKD